MNVRLSPYGEASREPSPVNQMMAAFAGDFRDGVDINLGVGYVNEKTIPVSRLKEAMEAVAADQVKYRQAFNYGGPEGSANLISSIRGFLIRSGAGRLSEDVVNRKRLVIGASGATSLLEALSEVMAPGIVVTSDPNYYIYSDTLMRKGFEVLAVPEDNEGIQLAPLEKVIGSRVSDLSFIYIVTVNNPSCTILSNARRQALVEFVTRLCEQQQRRIPIFFDQAYEFLLHDPNAEPFVSALPYDRLDIVYEIGTLSKILAPALRIGYLLGPDSSVMDSIVQKTSDAGFSAPLFAQEMASYLLDHYIAEQQKTVNAGYREKALAVRRGIDETLGNYLSECRGGSAGFYYYLTFKQIQTHTESMFFSYLTRTTGDPSIDGPAGNRLPRVVYLPGQYCVHPSGGLVERGGRQLRLSYGFEDAGQLIRALALMREAIEYAKLHPPRN